MAYIVIISQLLNPPKYFCILRRKDGGISYRLEQPTLYIHMLVVSLVFCTSGNCIFKKAGPFCVTYYEKVQKRQVFWLILLKHGYKLMSS